MSEKKQKEQTKPAPLTASSEDELLKKYLAHWDAELQVFHELIEKSEQITEEDLAITINA
jgi:hypothetical protein